MAISRARTGETPPQIRGRSPLESTLHELVRLLARQAARESVTGLLSSTARKASTSPAQERDDA